MMRYDDSVGVEVKTSITLMIGGITEEHTKRNEVIICAELWRTSLDNRHIQRPKGECRMDECCREQKMV